MTTAAAGLRSQALPLAVPLAAVAMGALLTDTVATSQMLALAGPASLSLVFALSGVAMAVAALVQFTSLDRRPRLTMLRAVGLGYAAASALALMLLLTGIAPVPMTVVVWLLGDQIQLLIPVLLWSLAGDVFNTSQATRINGWILYWVYGGQVLGLAVAALSPQPLELLGLPLPVVLVINPIACLIAALWVPRRMAGATTHQGNRAAPKLAASMASVRDFLRDVPVWRNIVVLSTLGATAGATALIGFSTSAESIMGPDAGNLQTYFGVTMLIVLIGCAAWQALVTPALNRRLRTAPQLLVLPVFSIIGGLVIATGDALTSLVILSLGIALVGIPEYTVEDSARHAALTVIPDSMRARITLVIDLCRFAVAQVAAGLIALIGTTLGMLWVTGIMVVVVAVLALIFGRKVASQWDDSLLNWRLQRRKHQGLPGTKDWGRPPGPDGLGL